MIKEDEHSFSKVIQTVGKFRAYSLSLLKRPCLPLKLLEKRWQAAQVSAGQGSSLVDGVGQKAQLMEVISGEHVNGNS